MVLPIVFIHAFPLHSAMWKPQREAFAGLAEVIALDLPGFGNEPRLDSESFTMKLGARFVQHELEARKIDRCVICGLSMGGYIAFECWKYFPEKIAGLVLASTKSAPDTDQGRETRYANMDMIGGGDYQKFAEAQLEKLLSPATRSARPEVADQVRRLVMETLPESAIAALLGMAVRNDSTPLLPTINVPVALAFGEHDTITTSDEGTKMMEALPDASLTIIPETGHLCNLEQPTSFNAAVMNLLERVG